MTINTYDFKSVCTVFSNCSKLIKGVVIYDQITNTPRVGRLLIWSNVGQIVTFFMKVDLLQGIYKIYKKILARE